MPYISLMYYVFSYGSNLLLERIQRRVFSVEKVQNHVLHDFELIFNKHSIDGSTKANLRPAKGSCVYGVIHRMPWEHKAVLDEYEALGNGYEHGQFSWEHEALPCRVHYYIAHDPRYLTVGDPYDWYLGYVISGAIENRFDPAYVERLNQVAATRDPNEDRREINEQVLRKYRL